MLRHVDKNKFVDDDTGELLYRQTVLRRENQIVKVFAVDGNKNVKHVKLRTAREQKRTYNKLTLEERGFLFSLLPYLDWETNLIIGDGEIAEKGEPLTWAKIDKVVGISKPTRIKIVRSLEEKRVIGYIVVSGKRVGIVVNPEYALRGRKPKEVLKQVFNCDKDVWDDYDDSLRSE